MEKSKNPHAGHRKRMRERYAKSGFDGWAEHEVLEFVLFDKIPRRDTNKIAHDILDKFGTIENALKAPEEQLVKIKGIGPATAKYLHTQEKIYNFCKTKKTGKNKVTYNSKAPEKFFADIFDDDGHERMYMVCLDAKDNILWQGIMFEGSFDTVDFSVGVVVRIAVLHDACKVVVAHNHPSGALEASQSDCVATAVMMKALAVVGVKLEDHYVVCGKKCLSILNSHELSEFLN